MDISSPAGCRNIDTVKDLDDLVERSHRETVFILKHSRTCGVSAQAYDEVLEFLQSTDPAPFCAMVVVQQSRQVSNAIAERFGIRHESPQALLLRGGQVVWHASHWRVNTRSLAEGLRATGLPV